MYIKREIGIETHIHKYTNSNIHAHIHEERETERKREIARYTRDGVSLHVVAVAGRSSFSL